MRPIPLALLALLAFLSPLSAQSPDGSQARFIGGIGIGGGTLGVAGQSYVGAATRLGDVVVRAAGTTDLDFNQSVNDTSYDLAILYGVRSRPTSGPWLRAAAGPALVSTTRRGARTVTGTPDGFSSTTEEERSRTVGLAIQLDLAWGRSRGLGLALHGNANGTRSFGAATLSLHLGSQGRASTP